MCGHSLNLFFTSTTADKQHHWARVPSTIFLPALSSHIITPNQPNRGSGTWPLSLVSYTSHKPILNQRYNTAYSDTGPVTTSFFFGFKEFFISSSFLPGGYHHTYEYVAGTRNERLLCFLLSACDTPGISSQPQSRRGICCSRRLRVSSPANDAAWRGGLNSVGGGGHPSACRKAPSGGPELLALAAEHCHLAVVLHPGAGEGGLTGHSGERFWGKKCFVLFIRERVRVKHTVFRDTVSKKNLLLLLKNDAFR